VANSIFLTGIGVGGGFTPILISAIMRRWGWQASFYICGAVGIGLAIIWHSYATSRPEEHPLVNAQELEIIRAGAASPTPVRTPAPQPATPVRTPALQPPWGKILGNISTWGLMASYFCEGYPNYIFYTWFFLYLVRARGMTVRQGGWWGALPFLTVALLAPIGGWFSDFCVARFGKRRGRQATVWIGMSCSAALLAAGAHAKANSLAVVLLSGALGFNIFSTSSWWAACNDLTRNFCGSVSALMNMCGNLGGWVSPILTAYIATRLGWASALDFAAVVTFLAVLLWIPINAGQNLEK